MISFTNLNKGTADLKHLKVKEHHGEPFEGGTIEITQKYNGNVWVEIIDACHASTFLSIDSGSVLNKALVKLIDEVKRGLQDEKRN